MTFGVTEGMAGQASAAKVATSLTAASAVSASTVTATVSRKQRRREGKCNENSDQNKVSAVHDSSPTHPQFTLAGLDL